MNIKGHVRVMNDVTLGVSAVEFSTQTTHGAVFMLWDNKEIELDRNDLTEFLLRTAPLPEGAE